MGIPLSRVADRTLKPGEVVTIYELDDSESHSPHARAVYNYCWTSQRDPFGVVRETTDYPGVSLDHASDKKTLAYSEIDA